MANVDAKRRVTLFLYNDTIQRWVDQGTGHVFCEYNQEQRCLTLIVKSEKDGSTLLEAQILLSIVYERQQVKNLG